MKNLIIILVIALFFGCTQSEYTAKLETPFVLVKNQTAIITEEGLSIKLIELYNSPCPAGVQCIWAGTGVAVQITKNEYVQTFVIEGQFPQSVSAHGYLITLTKTDLDTFAEFKVSKIN